jgi:hypothetical protein
MDFWKPETTEVKNMKRIIPLFLLVVIYVASFSNVSSKSSIYVSLSNENFISVEFRSYMDNYSNIFASVGLNHIKTGFRFSSKHTQGMYLSPHLSIKYNGVLSFGFVVGWSEVVGNLRNIEIFVEAGGVNIPQRPTGVVVVGCHVKF